MDPIKITFEAQHYYKDQRHVVFHDGQDRHTLACIKLADDFGNVSSVFVSLSKRGAKWYAEINHDASDYSDGGKGPKINAKEINIVAWPKHAPAPRPNTVLGKPARTAKKTKKAKA